MTLPKNLNFQKWGLVSKNFLQIFFWKKLPFFTNFTFFFIRSCSNFTGMCKMTLTKNVAFQKWVLVFYELLAARTICLYSTVGPQYLVIHAVFEKKCTKCLNVLSSYQVYSPEDCLLNMKPMVSKNGLSIVLHLFISPFISHPFWKVPESSSKIRKRFWRLRHFAALNGNF